MRFGWPRIHVATVDSTMPLLAELAGLGAGHGMVLTCDYQTAGRGRLDRRWEAPPGSALLMSVLIRTGRPAMTLPLLSLTIGEAVAETLESFGIAATVKWPNDVLVDDRKVCGILLRAHATAQGTAVVVGIGLNVTRAAEAGTGATSVVAALGRDISHQVVLDVLLERIDDVVGAFEQEEVGPVLDRLRARLHHLGEAVTIVDDAGASIIGTVLGLGDDGALLLGHDDDHVRAVHVGEIRRGPRTLGTVDR